MLTWIIQMTILSIVLIFLIHHLINFFKSTLTVPKIKDLVNTPAQKYENIYNVMNSLKHSTNENKDYDLIDLIPKKEENMKSELKSFLKSQLQNTSQESNITSVDLMSNNLDGLYSNYTNY
jgi:hypothetical protein